MSSEADKEAINVMKARVQFWHKRAMTLNGASNNIREKDYLEGQLELAQQLLTEILQLEGGSEIMEIGDNQMVTRVVKLSEIKLRRRRTETDMEIMEYCKKLDALLEQAEKDLAAGKIKPEDMPGGLEINTQRFSYVNIGNRMVELRKEGLIDPRFAVVKAGDSVFLVKKEKPVLRRAEANR